MKHGAARPPTLGLGLQSVKSPSEFRQFSVSCVAVLLFCFTLSTKLPVICWFLEFTWNAQLGKTLL